MEIYRVAYLNKRGKAIFKAVVLANSKEQAKQKAINKMPLWDYVDKVTVTAEGDLFTY